MTGLKVPVPHGLTEIIQTFGDVAQYIKDDGIISAAEEAQFLDVFTLPYPMIYAYNPDITIKRMRCHKLLVPVFHDVFAEILESGIEDECKYFGGCYNFRPKRLSTRLSTHCWAIAVDINPATNRMGTKGDMFTGIVAIFMKHGFSWGGHWKVSDPMHFQYAMNY